MSRPYPTGEAVALTLGAVTWAVGAVVGALILSLDRDDDVLDALGTGLVALLVGFGAALCAVATLVALAVAAVRQRGRLRVVTWAVAVPPAVAGMVALGSVLGPDEPRPAIQIVDTPSIAPLPPLPPLPSPEPLPESWLELPSPYEVPLPELSF